MGVGYCASPLHRITHFDTSAMTTRQPVKGSDSMLESVAKNLAAKVGEGAVRLRSPTAEYIVAWRERLAIKYHDQLEEELTWDEGSTFEVSEDVATGGAVMFHYVAAVLDQRGKSELSRLLDVGRPRQQELDAVFAEALRRSFGGRFPQLLLGASVWLPFKMHLMIEEPNWDGHLNRYGSVFHLVDEVTTVRAAIADARQSLTSASDNIIPAARQTSNTILRLAAVAAAKHLPFWTTG